MESQKERRLWYRLVNIKAKLANEKDILKRRVATKVNQKPSVKAWLWDRCA